MYVAKKKKKKKTQITKKKIYYPNTQIGSRNKQPKEAK